ncbi:hypothetical protein BABINDRAFT_133825 [Babjeviella inositovora NRRL Y-12698]|uniref:Endonuclease/exonuclease/phosphatase domain-containing protein n=1 Tax=Babjeviella inositovora NRRL Y-12698 TaxID=984486 RepID=A0A1E3QU54_9ASCO|nr:uncharacterized protein BABINDRAFT_133825 [Babjeviella inositovora NRRL Y-12698]ODQ80457.1 hypothetical protein BABINDRAFT_133825 [Babjeviella inositovora NRRL Y-12698]
MSTMDTTSKSPSTESPRIKLLTFNTWGLKYVSKLRGPRLRAIAERLAGQSPEDDYDIVALQEVWVEQDWDYIQAKCQQKYPFSRFFKSGILAGPGLCILSKHPIKETFLYRFPINGRPSAFWRGDWYVGKSIAVTIVQVGDRELAVLNSHMHAPYSHNSLSDANYLCHRACQAWDFSKFIKFLRSKDRGIIVVGDLNSRPNSLPHKLLVKNTNLQDSWLQYKGIEEDAEVGNMSPEEQISQLGITCDSQLNTWRATRQLDEACRLDYVLTSENLATVDASVRFTELIPLLKVSYLDHFAYSIVCEFAEPVASAPQMLAQLDTYTEFLEVLTKYQAATLPFQRNWRLLHMVSSLMIVVGILVGITFIAIIAPWSVIFFILLVIVLVLTGFVNGILFGGLFTRSENRALEEVKMEVQDEARYVRYVLGAE